MRATWLLMGMTGVGAVGAGTAWGGLTFKTLLDDNLSNVQDVGSGPYYVDNFVVGQGGTVAASIFPNNGFLLYGSATQPLTAIASLGTDEGDWAAGQPSGVNFSSFNTLSLSADQLLTFGAMNDGGGAGIYQYAGGTVPNQVRILASAASATALDSVNSDPLHVAPEHQVNAAGQVALSAYTTQTPFGSTVTGEYAVRGSSIGTQVAAQATAGESFNGQLPFTKAITPGGALVFNAAGNTGNQIVEATPGGAPTLRVEAASGHSPQNVLAATETRTLFEDGAGLLLQVKGAGWSEAQGASFISVGTTSARAEMTDGGKVAAADAVAGTISYLDSAVGNQPTTIAQAGMSVSNPDAPGVSGAGEWKIANLFGNGDIAPMVNESGVVLFGADITDSDAEVDHRQALLMWSAATDQISVILQAGQDLGDGRRVDSFALPSAGESRSVWSDWLADDGTLGLNVYYVTDALDSDGFPIEGSSLLLTRVPEPSIVTLICFATAGLAWRRPRRR
jgi:hypothetical protein